MDVSKFKEKYHEVFDENGNIKPCGRVVTKELISLCKKINPDVNFGDDRTGFMQVHNIKKLYESLGD